MFKNVRLPGSKNVLYFGLKCSKSSRFLGLPPRPRWGSLRRSPIPPSREGLLAFGNRSFAPSSLNPPLAPPNKNTRPVSPPKHRILEPPLLCSRLQLSFRRFVVLPARMLFMFEVFCMSILFSLVSLNCLVSFLSLIICLVCVTKFVASLICSRPQLFPLVFVTSLNYFFKVSIVSLSVCSVIALFAASILPSSICYVTVLTLKGFQCFIICLLRHCSALDFSCLLLYVCY